MAIEKNVTRRDFLLKTLALAAGCASAATGLFTLWKGKRADPFLSKDSLAVLQRFGQGQDLLDALAISSHEQSLLARRIVRIVWEFDAHKGLFKQNDFSLLLRRSVEKDFSRNDVVMAGNWMLSRTEVGIYVFNRMRRSGMLAS
jgi:hypothetical protein